MGSRYESDIKSSELSGEFNAQNIAEKLKSFIEDFDISNFQYAIANGKLDASDIGVIVNKSIVGAGLKSQQSKKKDRDLATVTFLALADQLNSLEDQLANQYGENFAEDMLANLYEQGLIEQQDFERIMAIEDEHERRQSIALNINEGLKAGQYEPEQVHEDPQALEWVELHTEVGQVAAAQGLDYIHGQKQASELTADGIKFAGYNADNQTSKVNELGSKTRQDTSELNEAAIQPPTVNDFLK